MQEKASTRSARNDSCARRWSWAFHRDKGSADTRIEEDHRNNRKEKSRQERTCERKN